MKAKSNRNHRLNTWLRHDVTAPVLKAWNELHDFHGSPSELVALSLPDPSTFFCTESFRAAYWRAEAWSKFPFDLGIDREKVAYAAFFEAEQSCGLVNERLADVWSRPIPEQYRAWLARARSLIHHLFEGFSLDEVVDRCGWGPGASTSLSRAQASPSNKWALAAHITQDALPYLHAFSQWSGRDFPDPIIVSGNKVVTVPKNAKTDRVIAIEPDWNMFFQLGFGRTIRSRLRRRFGLLRPCAQEINQLLAKAGSSDGFLATMDLKAASDSLSLAVVEALVPSDVYRHLLALRSPHGVVDGKVVTYEKISSMGNGFTFELETAIFYCLVRAASGHATVYGDDIIVVSSAYNHVAEFLGFCGFTVNEKKSFHEGPFRESCGGHFFKGVNVTPPYFRRPLIGPARITSANRISELVDNGWWRDGSYRGVWNILARGTPSFLLGPSTVPGCLHVPFDRACPTFSKKYQSLTGTCFIEKAKTRPSNQDGALLESLWKHPLESTWRLTGYENAGRKPVVKLGTWVSHWQEPSSWSSG